MTARELIARKRKKFGFITLSGNHPVLDFLNTVDNRMTEKEYDWLATYADAVGWAERADIIDPPTAERLITETHGRDTEAAYREIIAARATLYGILAAIIDGREPDAGRWEQFNALVRRSLRRIEVSASEQGHRWSFPDISQTPVGFLQPIVKGAADLLIDGNPGRLKRCADATCGYLFLDTSKNRSRQWCSMQTCGNRSKASRHYQRKRGAHGSA
ncbi:MAG: CGNR zinc finger domain-containing protein [Spirochaetales bacterium]|nr:CGNR zinc finger domain-containing protein [Spirochaetales bacterium]